MNVFQQYWHLYGFMSRWMRVWATRVGLRRKVFPQWSENMKLTYITVPLINIRGDATKTYHTDLQCWCTCYAVFSDEFSVSFSSYKWIRNVRSNIFRVLCHLQNKQIRLEMRLLHNKIKKLLSKASSKSNRFVPQYLVSEQFIKPYLRSLFRVMQVQ